MAWEKKKKENYNRQYKLKYIQWMEGVEWSDVVSSSRGDGVDPTGMSGQHCCAILHNNILTASP